MGENSLLLSPLPLCPECGDIARPSILMFDDWEWNDRHMARQQCEMSDWLEGVEQLLVMELGAGTAIPSIRMMGARIRAPMILDSSVEDVFQSKPVDAKRLLLSSFSTKMELRCSYENRPQNSTATGS